MKTWFFYELLELFIIQFGELEILIEGKADAIRKGPLMDFLRMLRV
jgi:hypothetical protein